MNAYPVKGLRFQSLYIIKKDAMVITCREDFKGSSFMKRWLNSTAAHVKDVYPRQMVLSHACTERELSGSFMLESDSRVRLSSRYNSHSSNTECELVGSHEP